MNSSNVRQLLKQHLEADDFMVQVYLNNKDPGLKNEAFYLCFPVDCSVDIFRVEGNHLTYHKKELSSDLETDDIELHCLYIEEHHAVENKTQVGT
ncbi:hypothetical protein OBP_247 [Pseudomonas phage OBP]|uniref:hypothetical protein n=1 Tax=Pseudomonas phage OBP TaxID=1124849 RepID=UPI000240D5DB|nr:hypothetical protein OBP_247 [Pseudomonas phage OBP]AEV89684.1 hypothetical protein OBP_247 [Pseudomonas phage OBP]